MKSKIFRILTATCVSGFSLSSAGDQPDPTAAATPGQTDAGASARFERQERSFGLNGLLGSHKKFNLADNCAIVMDGKTNGRLDDLKPGDRVAFSFGETNGVNAANRISGMDETMNLVLTTSAVC